MQKLSTQNQFATRRKAPRFALEQQARLQCPDWSSAERVATLNVSRGGMFLRSEQPPSVGAKIQVIVELPDGREVDVQAIVRHAISPEQAKERGRPAGVGVQVLPECVNEFKALVEIARLRQGRPPGEMPLAAPDAKRKPPPLPKRKPPPVPKRRPPPLPGLKPR